MPFLQMSCIGDVCICRRVPRIRSVSKTCENRLHQSLQVEQCHVSPKCGAKLFVPVKNCFGRGKRVWCPAEELAIEDSVPVRVGDHEIRYLQTLTFQLEAHCFWRVVPMPVAVVGVDMALSAIPQPGCRIVPVVEFQLHVQVLACCKLNSPLQRAILQATKGPYDVFPSRNGGLRVASSIEMEQTSLNPIQ